jgi:hypothetical protein
LPLTLLSNHRLSTKFEKKTEAASRDWISAFIKINQTLSICTQEQTSQGRPSGFKKAVVAKFFKILKEVIVHYNFLIFLIWDTDETGILTVFSLPPGNSSLKKA